MLVFNGNWREDLGAVNVQCRQVGAGGQYKGVSFGGVRVSGSVGQWWCMQRCKGAGGAGGREG